ncbi:UNKNOWN [Stylonychia lemnae]|uniref:TsaA-like domain-containing protein n=1 Tax=Stylonychia lemnae TaxID=5949 RepID=A0A078AJ30_STYLE|nr:UNKNOWN [Stylonychia lemnae]|eukprot:CDW81477.1 UNKNOWN [Stylonychia lemnae]
MESNTQSQTIATKDFIEQLKDFLNDTLLESQSQGLIPPILNASKAGTPRTSRKKQTNTGQVIEANWEFDAKDHNCEKYGNFSTSTIIKLVSKYNKSTISSNNPGNAEKIAETLAVELNKRLEDESEIQTVLHQEISKFSSSSGFLNVFLVNQQFMDRVHIMSKKKNVTYKEGIFSPQNMNEQPLESAFVIRPIGYLESCFREKFGTPRQSGFVKNARARLTLVNEINSSCLEGLNEYGYIWVIFIFHVGLHDYNNKKTKIVPPKLEGTKKGVFATRSPHRYNPIGLSKAKLDRIEDRTIYLSGIDLIHGTPVLDIKPYHYLDSLDQSELQFPEWLVESKERGRLQVEFSPESAEELRVLVSSKKLDFYDDYEQVQELISQVFELNPHSLHTLNKHKEGIYAVALDNMNIIYKMNEEKTQITIIKVIWTDNTQPKEKLRTKEWLLKISEIIDFDQQQKNLNSSATHQKQVEEEKNQQN